jgi:hypothetical protein
MVVPSLERGCKAAPGWLAVRVAGALVSSRRVKKTTKPKKLASPLNQTEVVGKITFLTQLLRLP